MTGLLKWSRTVVQVTWGKGASTWHVESRVQSIGSATGGNCAAAGCSSGCHQEMASCSLRSVTQSLSLPVPSHFCKTSGVLAELWLGFSSMAYCNLAFGSTR